MQYIKLDDDIWVEINDDNTESRIIVKSEVEQRIAQLAIILDDLEVLDDAKKLKWFEKHYPNSDDQKDLTHSKNLKKDLEKLLTHLV
jgi:hypothetical protein